MGMNFRSAPLDLLEASAVADMPKALAHIASRDHISEAVLVSTCHRTEAYVAAERFHAAQVELGEFFSTLTDKPFGEIASALYTRYDAEAAEHLFCVTAGLDSAVIGETEIVGQIKAAAEIARVEGTAGPVLNQLFRRALSASKRVRTETAISRHTASLSHAAVEMATQHLGTLGGRRVLVVGAGEMAQSAVVALAAAGPDQVLIANRSLERAAELAARITDHVASHIESQVLELGDLQTALAEVDVLLTTTGATSVIVESAHVGAVVRQRAGKPLLIVDLAVPRDVEQSVADIVGVTLFNMDDLARFAEAGRAARRSEAVAARTLIADEVERYQMESSAREMGPLIAQLRATGEASRAAAIEQLFAVSRFSEAERAAIERASQSIVAKLLHAPTVALKRNAGTATGDRLAQSLRDLFDL